MALYLPQWQKDLLGLSDAQVAHLERRGATSLVFQVVANMTAAGARAMGYEKPQPVQLARVLDPQGRAYDKLVYDHVDGNQLNFRSENLELKSRAANRLKARKPTRRGKRKLHDLEDQLP
jgi:hypothetical protein